MGSMHTGLEEAPDGFERMAAFYAARARGRRRAHRHRRHRAELRGRLEPRARSVARRHAGRQHRIVTEAVHGAGGRIALQILHAGRYAYHPLSVAPSALRSPITPFTPRALDALGRRRTIAAYVRCARLAQRAATTASRSWAPRAT
jgi:2,4-dienoyl-CoA reductase (NADPH2)